MDKFTEKENRELDFEISFYEELLVNNPGYIEALILLGDAYTRRGQYQKGLQVDLKLCRIKPRDPIARYNLACSYSLLNNIDLAVNNLREALQLGYRDLKWMNDDPDLVNVRKDNRYYNLIKKISSK